MPRKSKVVAISHAEPRLIAAGHAIAKKKRMSFSAYVVSLIESDLQRAGVNYQATRPLTEAESEALKKLEALKPDEHGDAA